MPPIIDRLLKRPPKSPPQRARGGSGRQHTDGFLEYDEINNRLTGLEGLRVFDEMWRTDADCRRAITMCVVPIVAGTWTVEPYRDEPGGPVDERDQQTADLVHWALHQHMRPRLPLHLWQALTIAGRAGSVPFEQVWHTAEWRGRPVIVPKTLDVRLPRTIERWIQQGPDLVAIEQRLLSGLVQIPADDLVLYRFGAEGDNWEGQSLLRAAYKHWKYKHSIELVQAVGVERGLVGVPTGWVPTDGVSDDQLDEFEEFLANIRANEASYHLFPGPPAQHAHSADGGNRGWDWEFKVPAGGEAVARLSMELVQYHTAKIDATILAEFMRLGQQGVGARATADVQQSPFYQLVEAICATVIEDPLNDSVVRRIVDLNDPRGRYPRVCCSEIDETSLEALGQYVATLVEKGAIRVEPRLESFLREKAGLPEADEDAIEKMEAREAEKAAEEFDRQQKLAAAKPAPDAPPAGKAVAGKQLELDTGGGAVTLARQDRDLRAWERPMSLDVIEDRANTARDRLEHAARDQARDHAIQVARALRNNRKAPAAPDALVQAIRGELADLYLTGRQTVRDELQAQARDQLLGGMAMLAAGDDPEIPDTVRRRLTDRAAQIADNLTARVSAMVRRLLLRPAATEAVLQEAAEREAFATLRAEALEHAMPVLNEGRTDQAQELADVIAGARYTSILDGRRCSACAAADDDVLRPLDDPVRLARIPPNPNCEGGSKCRCLEAFQLREEAAPDA